MSRTQQTTLDDLDAGPERPSWTDWGAEPSQQDESTDSLSESGVLEIISQSIADEKHRGGWDYRAMLTADELASDDSVREHPYSVQRGESR